MPAIATISCVLSWDATAITPATIPAPPSGTWIPAGNTKVMASDVPILDDSCQLMIPAITIMDPATFTASQVGNSLGPATFKFIPTAQKVKTQAGMVLCAGDKSQPTMVNFQGMIISGPSTAPLVKPYNLVIEITDAGQIKAEAQ